jgi:large-conductance mechanosensitive channel
MPQYAGYSCTMDDTPANLVEEFRTALLRKRVGQIALAVVLAQAAWRFINSLVWYCIIPAVGKAFQGHTETVLFETATQNPFPWERLFGATLEFILTLILAFYLNRWIHRRTVTADEKPEEYTSTGEPTTPEG